MDIQELAAETLVQKHRRLMQAKCKHEWAMTFTYYGPPRSFEEHVCHDCGKMWRTELDAN